jgi:glycosyltransferase involved in cell wall biosynthesis
MIKYSIILPYYNRKNLINTTLASFVHFYQNRNDFEIIIVDDMSSENHRLNELVNNFKMLNIKLIELGSNVDKKKNEVNPCYPYNVGVKHSSGEILILSSPETFHTSNMFEITNNFEEINDSTYILLSVFCSTDKNLTDNIINNNFNINHDNKVKMTTNVNGNTFNNKYGSWYLHSVFRKTHLNFLSVITRKTFFELSGFNEKYRYGTGYDDTEFLDRLKSHIDNFIYYDNVNAIHVDHEIVHNLPPTTNYNLYMKHEPYVKNDDWGIIKH